MHPHAVMTYEDALIDPVSPPLAHKTPRAKGVGRGKSNIWVAGAGYSDPEASQDSNLNQSGAGFARVRTRAGQIRNVCVFAAEAVGDFGIAGGLANQASNRIVPNDGLDSNLEEINARTMLRGSSLVNLADSTDFQLGRTSAPRRPQAWQVNRGSRSDRRTSSGHRSPLIAVQCEQ